MKHLLLPFAFVGTLLVGADAGEKSGAKQPPDGFTALFNGKDLSNWKNAEPGWKAENGVIHFDGSKGAKNLATAKNYKNFELWVDWKIEKGGDSGIYLRGQPQVQIWDNAKEGGSGGLYNNKPKSDGQKPFEVKDKKPGDWNNMYIKMVGTKVTVILNGTIVVDNAVFLDGKIPADGPLELQVHGTPLWFRNVFVRELK